MECGICFEEYSGVASLKRRPQLLPCGHEACESCLQQLHTSNNQVIKCPLCQTQHRINPSSLPVVYALIQDSTKTTKRCVEASCRDTACENCPHCQKFYCNNHFRQHYEEFLENCNAFVLETEETMQKNKNKKTSLAELTEATSRVLEKNNEIIEKLLKVSRNIENTVKEQKKLSKLLSDEESRTTSLLNNLKSAVTNRKDVDTVWTKWKNLDNHPSLTMDVEIPVVDIEALNMTFADLLSVYAVNSMASDINTMSGLSEILTSKEFHCGKFIRLSEERKYTAGLNGRFIADLAVVSDTSGFSLKSRVVTEGNTGSPLPNPVLLLTLDRTAGEYCIAVYNEKGEEIGKIKPRCYEQIVSMNVRDHHNEIIATTHDRDHSVVKLTLSGNVLASSNIKFDIGCFCFLPHEKIAGFCEREKTVNILSEIDLSLISTLDIHQQIQKSLSSEAYEYTRYFCITATSSHLVVSFQHKNARLLFYSLDDFRFVKFGEKEIDNPTQLRHYDGSIVVTTDKDMIQMSASGIKISASRLNDDENCEYLYSNILEIFHSSNGEEILVTAYMAKDDFIYGKRHFCSDNLTPRLLFYKL